MPAFTVEPGFVLQLLITVASIAVGYGILKGEVRSAQKEAEEAKKGLEKETAELWAELRRHDDRIAETESTGRLVVQEVQHLRTAVERLTQVVAHVSEQLARLEERDNLRRNP